MEPGRHTSRTALRTWDLVHWRPSRLKFRFPLVGARLTSAPTP